MDVFPLLIPSNHSQPQLLPNRYQSFTKFERISLESSGRGGGYPGFFLTRSTGIIYMKFRGGGGGLE